MKNINNDCLVRTLDLYYWIKNVSLRDFECKYYYDGNIKDRMMILIVTNRADWVGNNRSSWWCCWPSVVGRQHICHRCQPDKMPSLQTSSVQTLKAVDKALELPLVSSACSEMTRIASPLTPYVSSLSKVATQVEEKVAPHIPAVICRSSAAAVERADHLACEGIDQLTEKLPQLKEDTPKLLEGTKVRNGGE